MKKTQLLTELNRLQLQSQALLADLGKLRDSMGRVAGAREVSIAFSKEEETGHRLIDAFNIVHNTPDEGAQNEQSDQTR